MSATQGSFRCPRCASRDVERDPSRSAYELSYMTCRGCGHGELLDPWERDESWLARDRHEDSFADPSAPSTSARAPVPGRGRRQR